MADINEDKNVNKLDQIDQELKHYNSNNILEEHKNDYNDNSRSLADILGTSSSKNQNEDEKNNLEKIQNEITKNQDNFDQYDVDQAKELLNTAIDDINKDLDKEDNIIEKKSENDDNKIKRKSKFRKFLIKTFPTGVIVGFHKETDEQMSKTEDSYDNAKEKLETFKALLKRQRLKFVNDFKKKREEEQKEVEAKGLEGMNRIKIRKSFGHIDLIYLSILLMLILFIIGIVLAQ